MGFEQGSGQPWSQARVPGAVNPLLAFADSDDGDPTHRLLSEDFPGFMDWRGLDSPVDGGVFNTAFSASPAPLPETALKPSNTGVDDPGALENWLQGQLGGLYNATGASARESSPTPGDSQDPIIATGDNPPEIPGLPVPMQTRAYPHPELKGAAPVAVIDVPVDPQETDANVKFHAELTEDVIKQRAQGAKTRIYRLRDALTLDSSKHNTAAMKEILVNTFDSLTNTLTDIDKTDHPKVMNLSIETAKTDIYQAIQEELLNGETKEAFAKEVFGSNPPKTNLQWGAGIIRYVETLLQTPEIAAARSRYEATLTRLDHQGTIVVAAAGNNHETWLNLQGMWGFNEASPEEQAMLRQIMPQDAEMSLDALSTHVITVAASTGNADTTVNPQAAPFSSQAGPGAGLIPDLSAAGFGVAAREPSGKAVSFVGTSAATPVVSALVSRLAGLVPSLTKDQALQVLNGSGTDNPEIPPEVEGQVTINPTNAMSLMAKLLKLMPSEPNGSH